MDRERNRKQARKSRQLKKHTTDKMEQQLEELQKEAVSVVCASYASYVGRTALW